MTLETNPTTMLAWLEPGGRSTSTSRSPSRSSSTNDPWAMPLPLTDSAGASIRTSSYGYMRPRRRSWTTFWV